MGLKGDEKIDASERGRGWNSSAISFTTALNNLEHTARTCLMNIHNKTAVH